jgi:hypothetical protein
VEHTFQGRLSVKFRSLSEDHLERIQRRIEITSRNAWKRLETLRTELARSSTPRTREEFTRLAIRLQVVSEAMQEAAEQMR